MTGQYERYAVDADALVQIGHILDGQQPTDVRLPDVLAAAAVAAWVREQSVPLAEESEEQRRLRHDAATLALIGLSVENARETGVLSLHPDLFAEAVAAAQRER